LTQGSKAQRR